MKDKTEIFKERREWVNNEISSRTSGKQLSLKQRRKIWKQVWKEAKRKYK